MTLKFGTEKFKVTITERKYTCSVLNKERLDKSYRVDGSENYKINITSSQVRAINKCLRVLSWTSNADDKFNVEVNTYKYNSALVFIKKENPSNFDYIFKNAVRTYHIGKRGKTIEN